MILIQPAYLRFYRRCQAGKITVRSVNENRIIPIVYNYSLSCHILPIYNALFYYLLTVYIPTLHN